MGYVFTIIESVPVLVYPGHGARGTGHGVRGATWKADIVAEMVLPETWVAELQFRGGDWYFAKRFLIYRKGTFQLSLFKFWHSELLRLVRMFSWETVPPLLDKGEEING